MAGAVDRRPAWRGGSAPAIRSAMATNLASSCPGDEEHRHRQLRQRGPTAAPGCRCRRAAGSTARPVGRVPAAVVESPASGAAWRTAAGRASRSRNASTPSRSIVAASCVVARPPRAARSPSSSMPGGGADQHQPLDEVRVGRRPGAGTDGRPSSSRRTSPGRRLGPAASAPATRSARTSADAAVAGRVDGHDLVAGRRADRRSASHDRPVWVKPWTRTSVRPGAAPDRRRRAGQPARCAARRPGGGSTCTNTSGSWAPGIDQRPSMTYVGTAVIPASAANASASADLGRAVVAVEEVAARRRRRDRRRRRSRRARRGRRR